MTFYCDFCKANAHSNTSCPWQAYTSPLVKGVITDLEYKRRAWKIVEHLDWPYWYENDDYLLELLELAKQYARGVNEI